MLIAAFSARLPVLFSSYHVQTARRANALFESGGRCKDYLCKQIVGLHRPAETSIVLLKIFGSRCL